MRPVVLLIVLAGVLSACAPSPGATTKPHVRTSVDLSDFTTFAFLHDEPTVRRQMGFPELDPLKGDAAIRSAVVDTLTGKGFTLVPPAEADLLIAYSLDLKEYSEPPEDFRQTGFVARDWRDGAGHDRWIVATIEVRAVEHHSDTEVWRSFAEDDWNHGEPIGEAVIRIVGAALQPLPPTPQN